MQTPAPIEYERATSVEQAIQKLNEYGYGARLLAGGHSLIPMMKLRMANPEHLIDINGLHELDYIERDGDVVRIGPLTRHATLQRSELLAELFPIFAEAEAVIADPVVRNRGTIGGSLAQADPAEDLSAVCEGARTVSMTDFHVGPYMTAVGAAEMVTEVRLKVRPGAGSAHCKLERRAGDYAIAAASVAVWVDGGTIVDAGIALAAVGPFTIDAAQAAAHVIGQAPSEALFAEAGELAAEASMPAADGRGPIEYKRHLVGVLTKRGLASATARALHRQA
jgi:carbon-monoxide dehydrogenase medium subunit